MKTLIICGSIAGKSHTLALLNYINNLINQSGGEVTVWNLKDKPLVIAIPEYHKDPTQHPDLTVKEFIKVVEEADSIILGTPLYHGSYSGVLKNALDQLRWNAFKGKWIGLVGNAGGPRADHVSFSHLRNVVNSMVGYTIQTQVGTSGIDYEETADIYILNDQGIKERCQRLVTELSQLTKTSPNNT